MNPAQPPDHSHNVPHNPSPDLFQPFHPVIREWFARRYGNPTDAQRLAWPLIARGENVLVAAPTGSGKTLTAFLWAIDRLARGEFKKGAVRVLYVSPLKALNNDIRRNLTTPLEEIRRAFAEAGESMPSIRASVRSGDTPQEERRRVFRDPPEILITTPESLNILLTSQSGVALFGGLRTVILDEVHAVAGSKRGTHLMTAVERLTRWSGEFQRIALSATVRPLEDVAAWVGGFTRREGTDQYRPRPVAVVDAGGKKSYELEVAFRPTPETPPDARFSDGSPIWRVLAGEVEARVEKNRSTLVFANSRQVVERLARMVNEIAGEHLVWAHHGSLSREVREVVEERLKAGELAGIIATSSLELGIDIGSCDEVVLIGTPPSVASTIQRLGRSGHGVGETSRGFLYGVHPLDLLNAAVVARGVYESAVEPVVPVAAPLDVLAQVLLSMTALEEWSLDDLYNFLRTASPYRMLSRRLFDLVVDMLAGRYEGTRLPELRPRLALDAIAGTVRARPGTARLIYGSGGTIPDRGYYRLRLEGSGSLLGELDEEFVWERRIGETMTLGVQSWKINRITQGDVWVTPSGSRAAISPFWRFDGFDMPAELAERRSAFLQNADEKLDDPSFPEILAREHHLEPEAAQELIGFLRSQRAATGCGLPYRTHLVVEHAGGPGESARSGGRGSSRGSGDSSRSFVVLHTMWGGRINRPFSLAVAAALEEQLHISVETTADDVCVAFDLPFPLSAREILGALSPEKIEPYLRRKLEGSAFFGSRFRMNAGRALLLQRAGFGRRTPLWLSRQRAKELAEAVSSYPDFPIMLETWRTCLRDDFDLNELAARCDELLRGEITVTEVHTEFPSPFASEVVWRRTNTLMYEDDVARAGPSSLRPDLVHEVAFSSDLRPRIPPALAEDLGRKLQRLAPGYAPADPDELIEWVKERRAIPGEEWRALLGAIERDHGIAQAELLERIGRRVVAFGQGGSGSGQGGAGVGEEGASGGGWLVCALEDFYRLRAPLERGEETPFSVALDGSRAAIPKKELARARALAEPPAERVSPGNPLGGAAALTVSPADPAGAAATAATHNGISLTDPAHEGISLTDFLGEWLAFTPPITPAAAARALLLPLERLLPAVEELREADAVVCDEITAGAGETQVCTVENLTRLLRLLRKETRPAFTAVPLDTLPLFLAARHELGKDQGSDALPAALERLFGYVADAELWEEEFLPARLAGYRSAWLDALLKDSDLFWFGRGAGRIGFSLRSDWELFAAEAIAAHAGATHAGATDAAASDAAASDAAATDAADDPGESDPVERIFPGVPGRFELTDLLAHAPTRDTAELTKELWDLAWSGRITNDGFGVIRQGIATGFAPPRGVPAATHGPAGSAASGRRAVRFSRWKMERPFGGAWYRIPPALPPEDALEAEQRARDRVRILLDRYGVLFRELLEREMPLLSWSALFRTLRLMEFSGEAAGGHFFSGIDGPQFIAPDALRLLEEGLPEDRIWWINAVDPASPCGLGLAGLAVPRRVPTTHLVYRGRRLVVVSERRGRALTIHLAPDDPLLPECFGFLRHLLGREAGPLRAVLIQTINGEPAGGSPYRETLGSMFEVSRERGALRVVKRYGTGR